MFFGGADGAGGLKGVQGAPKLKGAPKPNEDRKAKGDRKAERGLLPSEPSQRPVAMSDLSQAMAAHLGVTSPSKNVSPKEIKAVLQKFS
tara:strand:+ start:312 stop:578 length:267 start_codon:yes stop_codon:yes gene_type:complete